MTRVAINGFGRIGRLAFRHFMEDGDFDVVAVNDVADPENLAYLLRRDSVHVDPGVSMEANDGHLRWGGRTVSFLSERDPASLPWKEEEVDIVVESTGLFTHRTEAAKHLEAGAGRVLISAPGKDVDLTVCMGVNEDGFDPEEHRIVSNASCTTNCLAPVAKILNDQFGIINGFLTTVHAYTSSQGIVDQPSKNWRRGRAAAVSIVPTTTGAAVATTEVLPELEGRLDGLAMRVPVPDGSIIDFVVQTEKKVTVDAVNGAFRSASEGERMKGIVGVSDEELVSVDIVGNTHSAVIDASSTMVLGDHTVKVLAWYDVVRQRVGVCAEDLGPGRSHGRPEDAPGGPRRLTADSMNHTTIRDIEVEGRRMLVRCDFNVPLQDNRVVDDFRIRAAVPTIEALCSRGARSILCSHLGRPGGEVREELRLDPVARRLEELLGRGLRKLDDCVGEEVESAVGEMDPGDTVLLENTRFHPGEEANDPDFSKRLAGLSDGFVGDAFAAAHRAHASTVGAAQVVRDRGDSVVAGLLMEREITALEEVRESPAAPYMVVMGGIKVVDKIEVLDRLLDRVDRILVGGGIANTFLAARGYEVGDSTLEEGCVDDARRIDSRAGKRLVLPSDLIVAREMSAESPSRTVSVNSVEPGWKILDVGPETSRRYQDLLGDARTVIWNGPLGAFEIEAFAQGTRRMAVGLTELHATTVTGGGETAAVVHEMDLVESFSHVSTGGGAFLEFMEGHDLPGLSVLDEPESPAA